MEFSLNISTTFDDGKFSASFPSNFVTTNVASVKLILPRFIDDLFNKDFLSQNIKSIDQD